MRHLNCTENATTPLRNLAILVVILCGHSTSFAYSKNSTQFPNFAELASLTNGDACTACHNDPLDKKSLTFFGEQSKGAFDGANNLIWSGIFDLDADCDGFSNGVELGDPEGAWIIGDEAPDADVTDPNDDTSIPSGTPTQICEPLGDPGGNPPPPVPDPVDPVSPVDPVEDSGTDSNDSNSGAFLNPVSCTGTNPMGWEYALLLAGVTVFRRARRLRTTLHHRSGEHPQI